MCIIYVGDDSPTLIRGVSCRGVAWRGVETIIDGARASRFLKDRGVHIRLSHVRRQRHIDDDVFRLHLLFADDETY